MGASNVNINIRLVDSGNSTPVFRKQKELFNYINSPGWGPGTGKADGP